MFFSKKPKKPEIEYTQEYAETQIRILFECGKKTEARFWEIRFAMTHGYDINVTGMKPESKRKTKNV